MITIRGNLKTGEWTEIARQADPRDVTIDQAAGAIARLIQKGDAGMDIRDEITIQNINAGWHVVGFRASEDRIFTEREQAAEYAARLGGKHFCAVVWLPAEL